MAVTWSETSRSGDITEDGDQYVKRIVGVMIAKTDTGYPDVGTTDAGASPTDAVTDFIVQDVEIDPNQQSGRVFVTCVATKLKAGA